MSHLLSYPMYLLALFLFSFIIWRKLKEDYTNEQIFGWTLRLVLIELLVLWMSETWIPDFTYLILFLSTSGLGYLLIKRLNFKFFEFIDAFTPAWLVFTLASWVPDWEIAIPFIALYFYAFFLKRYRRFSWYPSGKVGFAGIASLGIFFLLFAIFNLYQHLNYLYLSTQLVNGIIGLVLSVALFYMVYLRSGRK